MDMMAMREMSHHVNPLPLFSSGFSPISMGMSRLEAADGISHRVPCFTTAKGKAC